MNIDPYVYWRPLFDKASKGISFWASRSSYDDRMVLKIKGDPQLTFFEEDSGGRCNTVELTSEEADALDKAFAAEFHRPWLTVTEPIRWQCYMDDWNRVRFRLFHTDYLPPSAR